MPISPWTKGDRKPLWTFSLSPDSGAFDITGFTTADFKLKMRNISNGVVTVGTGTFSALTAASGGNPARIDYQLSTADVAALGMSEITVVVKEGTVDQRTFKQSGVWSVEA